MKRTRLHRNVRRVVEQIVELVHPLRVVLFGSAATGKATPDSDLDFLVVVSEDREADQVVDLLNTGIRPRPMPCDFIVVTPSVLRKHGKTTGLIYREIIEHGREVYAG
ncbi:MAG: hypothetical protein A3K19_03995 [Lentisphaerae bacterium RIFOXYB12_FULL_65_16]|nr:MAG: hypothetical protein A3K18_14165 [Lentisphaerae bacterium RIFOXYA12_64_32]OGV85241.1 MAG: hypothetical protein A3K19_03995 [Lentisphaerae bacterium RIFOXYB12_FULL_65_16]